MSVWLHVAVALPSEARPLLDAFGLRALEDRGGFRLYSGEGVRLIVTGVGKAAAAGGVGFLAGAFPENAIWLNVGIAGHASHPAGEVVMAHAVLDRASGQTFYPPLAVEPPVRTSRLVTVDRPETAYGEEAAFDMESAGFFAAARRFQTAELVHCLKVVSDGPKTPISTITREKVSRLIAGTLPALETLRERLEPLARELHDAEPTPAEEAELLDRWHFTVSDRRALRRELLRRRVLGAQMPGDLFADARRGRDVVRRLREFLDTFVTREASDLDRRGSEE